MVRSQRPLPFLFLFLFLFLLHLPCNSLSSNSTAPPSVAGAGPALQDLPFIVVWNMPTAKCEKQYNIYLNLRDFDIVENRQQRFQGQKMTIFYRDRLGMYPYISRDGEEVNGGIPQLGNLAEHLALSVMQTSSSLKPNFTGFAVIDWEEWRPLWEENFGPMMEYRRRSKLLVEQARPDLSDAAVTALAKQQFEESARKFMEETLSSLVQEHPKGFWGFYGFPACFNKRKRKTDKNYTGRCHGGTKKNNDRLSWLWRQSSALYPSIYLPQRLAGSRDAALMVRHRVLEALRVAKLWRRNTSHATPVLSYARLAFTHTLSFLTEMDLMNTLGESASLGAAGVVLWGELKFARTKHQCIILRDYIQNVLGPFVRSLRSDTHRCSVQHCHGKGRCIRRHAVSGHMVSSGRSMTSDPRDSSNVKTFHKHFMCQCYPGWTGKECREMIKD